MPDPSFIPVSSGSNSPASTISASPRHRHCNTISRRPIPRKGHTKSRTGCPNCKRRKVKCDEIYPVCGPCKRLKLSCEYDVAKSRSGSLLPSPKAGSTSLIPRQLSIHPDLLTFTDLRFFQHFLLSAFPPLPVGGRRVWHYISQMSHEYDFLVHSILGLGASHLGLLTPSDFNYAALHHRVTAIQQLNKFLSKPDLSIHDTEAAFAAILTLTYQAAHMSDGLADFLTLTRGCFLVGTYIMYDLEDSAFKTFERDLYIERAASVATSEEQQLPLLDDSIASALCASLDQLGPLCRSDFEIQHVALMRRIVTLAQTTDIHECYRVHSFLHEKAGRLSAAEFASFINPDNYAARLVIIHMLLLDCILSRTMTVWEEGPDAAVEDARHRYDARNVMAMVWIENIHESLPVAYRQYVAWPLSFARYMKTTFRADTSFWRIEAPENHASPEELQLELDTNCA